MMIIAFRRVACLGLLAIMACFDSNTNVDGGASDAHRLDGGFRDVEVGGAPDSDVSDSGVPNELVQAFDDVAEAANAVCRLCPDCEETPSVTPAFIACVYPYIAEANQLEAFLAWMTLLVEASAERGRCYEERGCEERSCSAVVLTEPPPRSWPRGERMCRGR